MKAKSMSTMLIATFFGGVGPAGIDAHAGSYDLSCQNRAKTLIISRSHRGW